MKKTLWIISLLVYLFASSSIVHGSMMGIFPAHQHLNTSSCHNTHPDNTKTNTDCCELVYSDQYSQSEIKIRDSIKLFSFDFLSIPTYINPEINIINLYKPYLSISPWWHPDIKYQKFSDLVWIIVDLA